MVRKVIQEFPKMLSLAIIYGIFPNTYISLLQTYKLMLLLYHLGFYFNLGDYWLNTNIISPIGYHVTDLRMWLNQSSQGNTDILTIFKHCGRKLI